MLGEKSDVGPNSGDILEYSSRIIDTGEAPGPVNRVSNQLSELAPGVALVESFSHSAVFDTGDGLVAFDTSSRFTGTAVCDAVRGWSQAPFHSLVYTHGHADHVGGSGAFVASNRSAGRPDPAVISHRAVNARLDRYARTNGWNLIINSRQFGGLAPSVTELEGRTFLPRDLAVPTITYESSHDLTIGDLRIELHHARGETDDHTWAWMPDTKTLCVGDLLIWVFPNAGNPQKVQRFPGEWAASLRRMIGLGAELLIPAHGLPIVGRDRIRVVLSETAEVLEFLLGAVLERMNAGWRLDNIVADVRVPDHLLGRPWLTPTYDEPEFVVRNIWRQFGGWWDANPATLKPSPPARFGAELVALAGGLDPLLAHVTALVQRGDADSLKVACELIEHAAAAEADSAEVHALRAHVYATRRQAERSLMAKGIFGAAVAESEARTNI